MPIDVRGGRGVLVSLLTQRGVGVSSPNRNSFTVTAPRTRQNLGVARRVLGNSRSQSVVNLSVFTTAPLAEGFGAFLAPRPYYFLSAERAVSPQQVGELFGALETDLLKGWFLSRDAQGRVDFELTASPFGVSWNGAILSGRRIADFLAGQPRDQLKPGVDCGALCRSPLPPGSHWQEKFTLTEVPAGISCGKTGAEHELNVSGLVADEVLWPVIEALIEAESFVRLEIIHPVLSVLVYQATLYRSYLEQTFSIDFSLIPATEPIQRNLQAALRLS